MIRRLPAAWLYQYIAWLFVAGGLCSAACAVGCAAVAEADYDDSVAAEQTAAPAKSVTLYMPEASGELVYESSGVTIDASHTDCGYVMVKCEKSEKRLKARVGTESYNYYYDMPDDETYQVFPFQQGSGVYGVRVLENVQDDLYAVRYAVELDVTLSGEELPFLYPNQYVNFTADSQAVAKAYLLVGELTSETKIADTLYSFVVKHLAYDAAKAKAAGNGELDGYLPDVDETLSSGKGICFDYSVLLAAMLRAEGVPTKVVIGVVQPENVLHAWNSVLIDGEWTLYDATLDGTGHRSKDYAPERVY